MIKLFPQTQDKLIFELLGHCQNVGYSECFAYFWEFDKRALDRNSEKNNLEKTYID